MNLRNLFSMLAGILTDGQRLKHCNVRAQCPGRGVAHSFVSTFFIALHFINWFLGSNFPNSVTCRGFNFSKEDVYIHTLKPYLSEILTNHFQHCPLPPFTPFLYSLHKFSGSSIIFFLIFLSTISYPPSTFPTCLYLEVMIFLAHTDTVMARRRIETEH